jgi:uncharacterized protein YjbI with pentapeptide repeats
MKTQQERTFRGWWLILPLVVIFLSALFFQPQLWPGGAGIQPHDTITKTEEKNPQGQQKKANIARLTTETKSEPGKTLWDWLSLLGVPITLAFLTFSFQQELQRTASEAAEQQRVLTTKEFNQRQELADAATAQRQKIAEDADIRQRELAEDEKLEEALGAYFDRMSSLLIDKNMTAIKHKSLSGLLTPDDSEVVQLDASLDVIRTRTLIILQRFKNDKERKAIVIQFLSEAKFISLFDLNLSSADLSGADLSRFDISSANLNSADLSGAILNTFSNLSYTILYNANLSCANLSTANLQHAELTAANLSKANLIKADLRYANLSDSCLTINGTFVRRSDVAYMATFRQRGIKPTYASGTNLSGADLSDANLSHANLSGAILTVYSDSISNTAIQTNLSNAILSSADLSGADLSGTILRGAALIKANLSGAKINGGNLSNAILSGANLSHANLSGADLSGANLSDTFFDRDGSLVNDPRISGADLSGADLSGADLGKANLTKMRNYTPEQIKSARNWQSALYNGKPLSDPENIQQLRLDA